MKFLKNIISVILVLAVINTVAAKAIHEFFEHQEEIHACINKDITHFHEVALQHQDLICSFNLSSSFLSQALPSFKNIEYSHNKSVYVALNWLIKNTFHHHFQLRGPPVIK